MKKFLILIALILIGLISPTNVNAISTTTAINNIDITKDSSLTLNYYYDNYVIDNTMVRLYYIAAVTSDFQYQLSSDFSNYQLSINNLATDDEWASLKQTIDTYITKDNIKETVSQIIYNNTITISNLIPGLYFIKTDKINNQDSYLSFDSSLISVPNLTSDGTWDYDIEIYPKAEIQHINKDNPNTRDNISLYCYLFIGSLFGLILLIIVYKKYVK